MHRVSNADLMVELRQIHRHLESIYHALNISLRKGDQMQEAMQDLKDALQRDTDATSAVTKLVRELISKVNEAPDLSEVRAITADFERNTKALVDATLAGTSGAA